MDCRIKLDLQRQVGEIDRRIFGSFIEHEYSDIFQCRCIFICGFMKLRRSVMDTLNKAQRNKIRS